MTVLKPCPHCGGDVVMYVTSMMGNYILCPTCGITCGSYVTYKTDAEMVELWNTRKGEPKRLCANCRHYEDGYDGEGRCTNPAQDDK